MYNNTAFISTNGNYSVYGLWGYILTGYSEGDHPHITGCTARNNIFYVRGEDHYLVSLDGGSTPITYENIILQGNCYFAEESNSTRWLDNNMTYLSLDSWQKESGQEIHNGSETGYVLNPALKNPGTAGLLKNPRKLNGMNSYQLEEESGIIDKGLDLKTAFGMETPEHDFFGNPSLQGVSQDIGFFETRKSAGVNTPQNRKPGFIGFPNPAVKSMNLTFVSDQIIRETAILSLNGELVRKEYHPENKIIYSIMMPEKPGMYVLQILFQSGEKQTSRIVVL